MTSNSEYLKKLGENLRIKRQEALLSQQELADISNVAKSTIQRIEKGTLNPSITNLKAICDALNITVQTLMSF
jgi:transcriptional regulator with XRE-family HTH domain